LLRRPCRQPHRPHCELGHTHRREWQSPCHFSGCQQGQGQNVYSPIWYKGSDRSFHVPQSWHCCVGGRTLWSWPKPAVGRGRTLSSQQIDMTGTSRYDWPEDLEADPDTSDGTHRRRPPPPLFGLDHLGRGYWAFGQLLPIPVVLNMVLWLGLLWFLCSVLYLVFLASC
jgi:hypothetical protein